MRRLLPREPLRALALDAGVEMWPRLRWSVIVAVPPEQLAARLSENVDPAWTIKRTKPFCGQVRGQTFCVRRQRLWKRYLQPRMYGEIVARGANESLVTIRVRPHLGVLYYLGRIVALFNVLMVPLYAGEVSRMGAPFVVSLLLALAFTLVRYTSEVDRAEDTLTRVLKGE